jgi:hypothetical protein
MHEGYLEFLKETQEEMKEAFRDHKQESGMVDDQRVWHPSKIEKGGAAGDISTVVCVKQHASLS